MTAFPLVDAPSSTFLGIRLAFELDSSHYLYISPDDGKEKFQDRHSVHICNPSTKKTMP